MAGIPFDPSQPFEEEGAAAPQRKASDIAPFDPSKPFSEEGGAIEGAAAVAGGAQGGGLARGIASAALGFQGGQIRGIGENFPPTEQDAYKKRVWQRVIEGVPMADALTQVKDEITAEQAAGTYVPPSAKDTLSYKVGSAIEGLGQEALAKRPGESDVVRDIGSGIGSVVANIGGSVLTGGLSNVLTPFSGSAESTERARREGVPEKDMPNIARQGLVPGATDWADVSLAKAGIFGKTAGTFKRVLGRLIEGGVIEGTQEGIQQGLQNLIAKYNYKPGQDWTEGVLYNAAIGAIVGSGAKVALAPLEGDHPGATPRTREEQLAINQRQQFQGQPGQPYVAQAFPGVGQSPSPLEAGFGADHSIMTSPDTTTGTVMSPEAVTYLDKTYPPPEPMKEVAPTQGMLPQNLATEDMAPLEGNPGVDPSLIKQMGAQLYGGPAVLSRIMVKEFFQNAFDSIKDLVDAGQIAQGKIDILMNKKERSITVRDNGTGIPPEVLTGAFLQAGGTHKVTKRPSGGHGVAKLGTMYGSDTFIVQTLRDGVVYTMSTTGDELYAYVNKTAGAKKPLIQRHTVTEEDRKMFPSGHGTIVRATVPEHFADPNTGELKEVPFEDYVGYHNSLQQSPLFSNIEVNFNGNVLPKTGSTFNASAYSNLLNLSFPWGKARVYTRPMALDEYVPYDNVTVLSNGLYQFGEHLANFDHSEIKEHFFIDIQPSVSAKETGYPIRLDRQGFSPHVSEPMGNVFNFIRAIYQLRNVQSGVPNFGNLEYVVNDGGRFKTKTISIAPPKAQQATPATEIRLGEPVEVTEDGKLVVRGRQVPDLDIDAVNNFKVDNEALFAAANAVDPNSIIMHDATEVKVSDLQTMSISEFAREKFGWKFDSYVHAMGQHFIELRNIIAKMLPARYGGLMQEGIGISFDAGNSATSTGGYRGVSIRIPFSASFLNIALPVFKEADKAGVGMVGTMIHELAHHTHRSEKDLAPVMQELFILLQTEAMYTHKFNFMDFQQRVIDTVSAHQDVFNFMRGVLTDGIFPVSTRGKRLSTTSNEQVENASLPDDNATGRQLGFRAEAEVGIDDGGGAVGGQSDRSRVSGEVQDARRHPEVTRRGNQTALDIDADGSGVEAVPEQPETTAIRRTLQRAFGQASGGGATILQFPQGHTAGGGGRGGGGSGPVTGGNSGGPTGPQAGLQVYAAHADRMNWFYKWWAGLDQLVGLNPFFTPLLRYAERIIQMHNEETSIHEAAVRIGKAWRGLGEAQSDALCLVMDDLAHSRFLSAQEIAQGIERHPTQNELQRLFTQHGLQTDGQKVLGRIQGMFGVKNAQGQVGGFLALVRGNAFDAAARIITDPVKLMQKQAEIDQQINDLASKPYFPFLRFGRHFVMEKNSNGKVVRFQTFEMRGLNSAEMQQAKVYREARAAAVRNGTSPDLVTFGKLPEEAAPFMGLPPTLLSVLETELNLTPTQVDAMQQLQLRWSPALNFKHMMKSNYVAGYSMDFKRAFAKYFFHGARYHARAKFGHALRGEIEAARNVVNDNKASKIADYMEDHLNNTVLDAKGDFGWFKAGIFLWAMGYVPAAATQNLSQTVMITLPHFAAKFGGIGLGDVRASAALIKAMTDLTNFYKKGTYTAMSAPGMSPDFHIRALDYGIKTGRISETQAPELAGMSTQSNLMWGIAGNAMQRLVVSGMEKASYFFEMAEQFNRRVAFRAALELATKYPNSKAVREALRVHSDEYRSLYMPGVNGQARFTQAEAAAVVTAAHMVDETQFVYAKWARPRFMRGKLPGALLVFKKYMQSVLTLLGNNKSDTLPRYLLIAAALGGLGGIPGYDDFRDLIRAWFHWKGERVNLDHLVRQWVIAHTKIPPDLVLHGFSRAGFGVPAIVDMLGGVAKGQPGSGRGLQTGEHSHNIPFPVLDRSKALSMGNILPFEVGKLLDVNKDVPNVIAEQTQKASGAVFSVGFNMYKMFQAIAKGDGGDLKTYEKAMPRALASLSRAGRTTYEGRERGKGGPAGAPTVTPYDIRDPEQMMEILSIGMGYQTLRQQSKWDSIMANAEVKGFFDLKRTTLLEQSYEARTSGNPKEIEAVNEAIKKFNLELPDFAKGKGIRADTVVDSMRQRTIARISKERGVPQKKEDVGISNYVHGLFPESTVDVRRPRE